MGHLEGNARSSIIDIPDPCLVALVGAAGSGKSTFAARHFDPDEVLSSDAFRALIAGDAADQSATRPAFAALHRALVRRLLAGRLTVVDSTNVHAHARRALLHRARTAGMPAIAIVLDVPPDEVLARNAARPDRVVPEAVVRRQLLDLDLALRTGRLETEGFSRVVRLRGMAADGVRIRRVPR